VLGRFSAFLHGLEMHSRQSADDLQMAQFFCSNIHQKILADHIFAVDALDGILHGRGKFSVSAAELLQEHVAETGIRLVHVNRVHEFFDVMIHVKYFLYELSISAVFRGLRENQKAEIPSVYLYLRDLDWR
jgi:hypothetical protein